MVGAGRRLGDVVLDGELVALREGKLDFVALASSPRGRAGAGVTEIDHRARGVLQV